MGDVPFFYIEVSLSPLLGQGWRKFGGGHPTKATAQNVSLLLLGLASMAIAVPSGHSSFNVDSPGVVGDTIHDNNVYFDSNVSVTTTFVLQRYAISSGQPFKGVTFSGSVLDVHAGRHGSTGPAAQFIDDLTLLNMLASTHFLDAEPKELNFAVFGTLNITLGTKRYSLPNFRIAQGHYSFTNNWWFAADYCINDPATGGVTLVCKIPGFHAGKLQFHGESSDHIYVIAG